ncbi:Sjogren's syndrome/scleroderma autoantigen 1 family protein [Methanoplanus limicola]|uniref:Sjogrens syndrome scleroderma autoantigen 1 n=1 Tax=Methanoplanus limicola DSM 2279 TaxID=937775 RepID=H1Z3J1_9EURY|nr:Sjogren's syndrome/scleroderma autoantigen 1 family protein [Methanoplanus limicola]EHQ34786.1 Sjogrens syndrome scleroderma autoantigen 1 [Methanoplanus limicola DSM 2279]
MRNPEDIMADYLLKGGKMLEKSCPVCGSPLFIVKGETLCVVCAENSSAAAEQPVIPDSAKISDVDLRPGDDPVSLTGAPDNYPPACAASGNAGGKIPEVRDLDPDSLYLDIEETIKSLCARVRNTANPGDCLTYMECIQAGTVALKNLKN